MQLRCVGLVFALVTLACEAGCSNPQAPLVGLASSGGTTSATSTSGTTGGSSSGTGGATTTGGATSSGTTGGGTPSGTSSGASTTGGPVIPPTTLIDAGTTAAFAEIALAYANGEAELFFSQTIGDGGYAFALQHLTPAGNPIGAPVAVAVGAPLAPPAVAVASDGMEVAACWEDYGTTPDYYQIWYQPCGGPGSIWPLVLCNSVAVGGSTTDGAMDGGFVGCGSRPSLSMSTSSVVMAMTSTLLSYLLPGGSLQFEVLYWPWGGYGVGTSRLDTGTATDTGIAAVAGPKGYTLLVSDQTGLRYTPVEVLNRGTGGVVFSPGPPDGGGSYPTLLLSAEGVEAFAMTHRSDDGGPQIGIVLAAQASGVISLVLEDPTTSSTTAPVTVNSPDESPLGLVAATSCGSRFAYVYAVDGGNVMLRTAAPDGALSDGGSTAIGNLGTNATSIAFVATDGGALLALGTVGQIGLYFVPCP
jgi:hypothetical protein